MRDDRPLFGIALMLGFCLLAPMSDAIAKLLGGRLPLLELLVARFGIQAVLLAPVLVLSAGAFWPRGRLLRLVFFRTLLHIAGIGLMFLSLRYLPLADAVAIAFVMPFILLLLGRFILNEEIGMRRIMACAVGFFGTLLVIQPSFAEVGPAALLPVCVAVIFAGFMLVTRMMSREIGAIPLQAVGGTMALGLLLPCLFAANVAGVPGFDTTVPDAWTLWLLLTLGLLGTVAHLLMTWSLRFAPASTLAPMQYLEIPVAAVVGWFIFREFPNGLALAGISITIAAGLYIVLRERRFSQMSKPASPHPAPPAA
ncbi:MAG: DMT family transporter [Rhodobacteraceae bacterium]|nr:DMT family transporter [Alphaproteobacteria bacterium]NNF71175.1 DMT family transporter [Paracoccaceae bacterium]NNK65134.1 DMT family transporter [Paracoccaceae bacterium]